MEDLSVAGPGSPVSLKKVLNSPDIQLRDFNVFVTNDVVIAKDDPDVRYITAEECRVQALWFLNSIFDGKRFPHYCYHHFLYMFGEYDSKVYKKYPDSYAVKLDIMAGNVKETDEDFKLVQNLFIYGKDNPEFLQLLGMIQLLAGTIKSGAARIYIEHPETHLHPKRQSKFIVMFNNIKEEYSPKPLADTEYDSETASLKT